MNRSNVNILVYCLLVIVLCLSSCSIKMRVKRADRKFAIGEYYDAADIYKKCYGRISSRTDKPLKAHVAFSQGECLRILNQSRALQCYQNAIRNKYQDSIVYLRLAQVQQYQGKYNEADKNYLIYLQAHPTDYVAQAGHYACTQVKDWKKEPTRYKVQPAKEFNAKRTSNFAPAFIGNSGDALMFTSNRQQTSSKKKFKRNSSVTGAQTFNLWTTRRDASGKWEDISLPEGLYSDEPEEEKNDSTGGKRTSQSELGACCFSADGKTMFFTFSSPVNGQDLGAKIYVSSRAAGEWGEPQEVKLFRDSSITVGHPTLCPTGDTLIFASDAPGGYGGKDLWMAELDGEEWVNVRNMGPKINTSGDEMYPTMHADGSLYFASNGHPGYGGLDIFKAERDTVFISVMDQDSLGPIAWQIYNMGTPFNSNNDDFGITFAGNSQNGFFSTNRNQKKAYDAIWSFTLPEMVFAIEGKVTDTNGEVIADASLRLVGDDGTNTKVQVRRDGTYRIKLNKDARYVMLGLARGFLNQKQELNTHDLKDSKTYKQDFTLAPISKPVTMDNIFYEFGKWDLTPESEAGLKSLVKMLNDNPNITIELSAHTDLVGNEESNIVLSQKRAQSVVNYLIKAGIEAERLTPVGYGETKPVIVDKVLKKRYSFLPMDQVLDEAFIMTLPADKQEICNQINRRTEFKVLKTTYKLY